MHIFQKGAVFSNSKCDIIVECDVLVADIFELNMDMKAMLMLEVEPNCEYDDNYIQERIKDISKCDTFKCSALAAANVFDCTFRDCEIEADYRNYNIARVYIKVDNIDHQECRPTINNYDQMIEIMNDKEVWQNLK